MKELQFNTLNGDPVQVSDGIQHLRRRFSGKKQDHMYDNRNVKSYQCLCGIFKYFQIVTTTYETRALGMDGLQPKLDPYRFDPIQFIEKCKNLVA